MTDSLDSVLPESLRDHPSLARLRASLLAHALAPEQALLEGGIDPVACALALSEPPPDISE